ncbi:MAG: hypothetical protein V1820_03010 [archaeon]
MGEYGKRISYLEYRSEPGAPDSLGPDSARLIGGLKGSGIVLNCGEFPETSPFCGEFKARLSAGTEMRFSFPEYELAEGPGRYERTITVEINANEPGGIKRAEALVKRYAGNKHAKLEPIPLERPAKLAAPVPVRQPSRQASLF